MTISKCERARNGYLYVYMPSTNFISDTTRVEVNWKTDIKNVMKNEREKGERKEKESRHQGVKSQPFAATADKNALKSLL